MKILRYILVFFWVFPVYAQQQQLPQVQDIPEKELSVMFDGKWLPSLDALQIGHKNYKDLKNLRYGPENIGLEGIRGYTKLSSTAIADYPRIRSAYQLSTDRTTKSYLLVQTENSTETVSRVYVNTASIPDTGDFSTSVELDSGNPYRVDTNGAGLGRFSPAPNNSIVYSNGVESLIWSGEEMSLAALYTFENADPYNSAALPIEATNAANNTLSTTGNTLVFGEVGARDYLLVMTSRPIQGVYFDVLTGNTTTAVLDIHYWKSDASWAALTESDATLSSGKTMAQDGWVTWDFVTDASPYHYQGNYYYAYRFYMNDSGANTATATLQYLSVNSPMQAIVDLWDGIPRQPKQFQIWRDAESKFKDWTLEVNEYSYEANPFVAQLDAMASVDDYIIVMADDRLSGVAFDFMAGWVNTTASTTVIVKYWSGNAWVNVTETDGTDLSGVSLAQDGLIWWTPPAETAEAVKTEFGTTGYAYKIYFDENLSGTYSDEADIMSEAGDVALDVVTVYPAQKTVPAYKLMAQYKGRVMGCGYITGKQGNRCDYTQKNSTEIWNGADSSDDGVQSLYFDTSQDITVAKEIYNRYGSQVITVLSVFTKGETHVLKGDSPDDFATIRVSENIGCPAPLTLVTAEVGYEVAPDLKRNIQIWLSSVGPYGFDGQILFPIGGVDNYFDPDNDDCINFDEIERARGWYDKSKKEYNLLIPSGASQTTNNVWLVYDLVKKKWFRKDTGDAGFPQVGFAVEDTYGVEYTYGGIDSGFLVRLENGTSWDGTPVEHLIETGDFWPTGNIWDLTRIRQVKFMAKRLAEDYTLTVNHYVDTDEVVGVSGVWADWDGGGWEDWVGGGWQSAALGTVSFNISDSRNRIARDTIQSNIYVWTVRLRFLLTTDDTENVPKLLGWGIVYQKEDRRDE